MKIFHKEQDKEVVYVQMQDIMYIYESFHSLPATVHQKVFKPGTATNVCDSNRFDFVRFDNESDVEYFRGLEFILDFDKYFNLSFSELQREFESIVDKFNEVANRWNSMTVSERKKEPALLTLSEDYQYMLDFIHAIEAVKLGKTNMPFPDFVILS